MSLTGCASFLRERRTGGRGIRHMNPWDHHPPQAAHDARQLWEAVLSLHQGDSLGEAAAGRCSIAQLREEWRRLGRARRAR